jgi:hypothetical protein
MPNYTAARRVALQIALFFLLLDILAWLLAIAGV